ncbi:MAG: BspA family leucine-rich repeat surface protein [Lachnospiraceae bacterium]|nr:BspA family leucine-rich repeat surface protein [Lachnospiraceae bacterium]
MKRNILKIVIQIIFILLNINFAFAAKYTICNGKEFNTRIKMSINTNYNSSTPEYNIVGFDFSPNIKGKAIDISEDGDQSVLAYIDNNIIYYVSDEDVYLNSDCSYMFDKFIGIKKINLSNFDFKKIKKANFMFGNCKYLEDLNMDNETEIKLDEMIGMFFDCQSLKDLDLTMINTKNVKSFNSLFYNCKNLQNIIINPSIFKTNNVKSFDKMYYNCLSLKTNYNLKVTDIKEEKYNVFTRPGTEYLEGLLRDYDYDYVELVQDNKSYKIDNLKDKINISDENQNIDKNIDKENLNISKGYIDVELSPENNLYNISSDDRINIDGKMNNEKYINKDTLKDVPILIFETTFVDKLVPKNKSTYSNIIEGEKDTNSFENNKDINAKGILRPDLSNMELSETYKVDESIIDFDYSEINKFDISNYYSYIIFIIVFLLITAGIIIFKHNNQNGDDFKDI